MKKVVIFARVSTIGQDYERQVNELTTLSQQYSVKRLVEQRRTQNVRNYHE